MKQKKAETAAASNDAAALGEKMRAGMAGMEAPDDTQPEERSRRGKRGR